jgi:hypothetical protein
MKNNPLRSDSKPLFPRTLAGRHHGARQASAALIVAVWALLWIWVAAGVVVPLSRITPPGGAQRAASQTLGT